MTAFAGGSGSLPSVVALLITGLVRSLILVPFEVPLLAVIPVARMVIPALAHTLLVCLVFRKILMVFAHSFLGWSVTRRLPIMILSEYCASADTGTNRYRQNPDAMLPVYSHNCCSFVLHPLSEDPPFCPTPNCSPKRARGYFTRGTPMAFPSRAVRAASAPRRSDHRVQNSPQRVQPLLPR